MSRNKKVSFFIVILIGIIFPFVEYLVIIEGFYLLIPFGIIFTITLIYLIISLFNKNLNNRKAIFVFLILPVFIISQVVSTYIVDKVQKIRSNIIITEIEKIKTETGFFPEKYDSTMGIEYITYSNKDSFTVKYSRGFFVTEEYDSKNKKWRSYGWND